MFLSCFSLAVPQNVIIFFETLPLSVHQRETATIEYRQIDETLLPLLQCFVTGYEH